MAVVGVLLVVPTAAGNDDDDLKQRHNKVEKQVKGAKHDLHRSSKKVQRLDARLADARKRLGSARTRLSNVQKQFRAARVRSDRVTAQLERAQDRLELAAAELRQARQDVAEQSDAVRTTVTDLATQGDPRVAALTSMLDSGSLEELMINRTAGELVVNTQFQSLVDLEAAEAAMVERKQRVKTIRNEVATKKRQADSLVRRKQELVAEAASVRKKVRTLVGATATAKKRAQQARAQDRKALRKLKARELAIRRKILAARDSGRDYSGRSDGYLTRPANGPITSGYGYRTHPIYGYRSMHDGVDFGAPCGSPLRAGASGKVVHAYYDDVYGYRLYLAIGQVNGDRITLVYNHMSGSGVGVGQRVGRGGVVGRVGTTGWSTGCHLHFTVLRNGNPVNPMTYL